MRAPGLTRRLLRICQGWRPLRRFEPGLYRRAEREGQLDLVRERAGHLLERAHVHHLTGREDAPELAAQALDRYEHLAGHGDPEAAFQVAEAHRTGFGRPRNHWLALDHARRAAGLGHPLAAERLRRLEAGEPIEDDSHAAFGRRALLRAAYTGSLAREDGWRERLREIRQEGIGLRGVRVLLLVGVLLASYMALDIYFYGMGGWRPDPTRVVWGLFGKIHPPRGAGVGKVLPGWLRPDAGSVALARTPIQAGAPGPSGTFRLADLRGQVVYLHVVDGRHPAVVESVPMLRRLELEPEPGVVSLLVYLPDLERPSDADQAIKMALEVAPAFPAGPRAIRPLGRMTTFPMNFVIDRRGRIRQRWAGFSEALTARALAEALAET